MEPTENLTTGAGTGERKNKGKLRYDLIPSFANQELARVLTKGAEKYADNNWRGGMTWLSVIASMKRHIAAFEAGEDIDPETGCYHTAQIQCNASFLTEFYRIFPQGDNRLHKYLQKVRIGLDVDEVLAGFVSAYMRTFEMEKEPEFWSFCPELPNRLKSLSAEWWLALKPITDPSELGFEPVCYITSRVISSEVTTAWLNNNRFPFAPVFTVKTPEEKLAIAKEQKLDIFVDDNYSTFVQLNKAGICCFLMDAAHNRRYNVGHKRIKSLSELTKY